MNNMDNVIIGLIIGLFSIGTIVIISIIYNTLRNFKIDNNLNSQSDKLEKLEKRISNIDSDKKSPSAIAMTDFDSTVIKYMHNPNYNVKIVKEYDNIPECDLILVEWRYNAWYSATIDLITKDSFHILMNDENTIKDILNLACINYTEEYCKWLHTSVTNQDLINLKLIKE